MIKRVKNYIKFIISGDYNQLKPVYDRISQRANYFNSSCLFEQAGYNKIQLTKCRRANDKIHNFIKFDNVPKITDFTETNEYKQQLKMSRNF